MDEKGSRGRRRSVNVAIALAVAALTFGATQLAVALRPDAQQEDQGLTPEPSGSTDAVLPDQGGEPTSWTSTVEVPTTRAGDPSVTSSSARPGASLGGAGDTQIGVPTAGTPIGESRPVRPTVVGGVGAGPSGRAASATKSATKSAPKSATKSATSAARPGGATSASTSPAQAPVARELQHRDPSLEGGLKSDSSGVASTLRILNRRNERIEYHWLDYSGSRVRYGSLDPGGQVDVPTFIDHPWLITRADGSALFIVLPTFSLGTATVT